MIFLLFLGFFSTFWNPSLGIILTPEQETALCVIADQCPPYYPTWNCLTVSAVCSWIGIACDPSNTTVTAMLLLDIPTLSYIPPEIGSFTDLQLFGLLETSVSVLPSTIGNWGPSLATLILDFNNFTDLPDSISNLLLQRISLDGNLFSILPPSLSKMTTLIEIFATSNHLNSLPVEIFHLPNLEVLDVSFNNISTLSPTLFNFISNTSLRFLGLENDHFFSIPSQIAKLYNLQELRLDSNYLSSIPTEIGLLSNLRILTVFNNSLQSLPTELGQLSSLVELQLETNKLSTLPTEIGNIFSLEHLDIGGNLISQIPIQLSKLNSLTYLDMSINRFNGSLPDPIYSLTNLRYLRIDYNHIHNVSSSISSLTRLTAFYINENQFSMIVPFPLESLRVLEMSSNNIAGIIPSEIAIFQNLTRIVLSYNKLSGTIPTIMGTLNYLETLFLSGNAYTNSLDFTFLSTIIFLDLSFNRLTSVLSDPDINGTTSSLFRFPPKLTNLDLSNNIINSVRFPFPGVLDFETTVLIPPQIVLLDLSGNLLTGTLVIGLAGVPKGDPFVSVVANRLSRIISVPSGPFHPFKIDSPQDIDECLLQVHDCPPHSNCTDGWKPKLFYTCTCDPGYEFNLSALPTYQCININECQLAYDVCPDGFICRDLEGSYECLRDLRPLYISLPTIVATIIFLVCNFFLYRWLKRKYSLEGIKCLPKEVRWSYEQAILAGTWKRKKNENYLMKSLKKDSTGWTKVTNIMSKLKAGDIQVKEIHAVYNPILVSSFIQTYKVQSERKRNDFKTFFSEDWRDLVQSENEKMQREFVYDRFQKFSNVFSWNQRTDWATIIPLVHGTDILYAKKICATGFAALSSIDEGWFGKGIYFTSFIIYTLPYIRKRRYPTIILSWVLPGNVYPVVESPKDPTSLVGRPIKNRYQSHYILTNREGHPSKDVDDDIFDEMVIGQEAQIAPAFIVEIDSSNFNKLNAKWSNKKGRILAGSVAT